MRSAPNHAPPLTAHNNARLPNRRRLRTRCCTNLKQQAAMLETAGGCDNSFFHRELETRLPTLETGNSVTEFRKTVTEIRPTALETRPAVTETRPAVTEMRPAETGIRVPKTEPPLPKAKPHPANTRVCTRRARACTRRARVCTRTARSGVPEARRRGAEALETARALLRDVGRPASPYPTVAASRIAPVSGQRLLTGAVREAV
jgi:hypothetical protein